MKLKIILVLFLLVLTVARVFPQAKKPDTLMWFVGHWQSQTIFQADSNYVTGGGANSKLTVSSNGSVTVNSAAGQQLNQQITNAGTQLDNMESGLQQQLQPEGLNEYNLYNFSKAAIDSAKEFYFGLKVPDPPNADGTSSNPTYQTYNAIANVCIAQENPYNTIIDFWKAHKSIKNEHYDYPPPPQADYFNCWGCNLPGQREFARQRKVYDTTFFEPEMGMIKQGDAILEEMTEMGLAPGQSGTATGSLATMLNSLFAKSKQNPANNGPCAFIDYDYLTAAVAFLVNRLQAKADQLVKDMKSQQNFNSYIPAVEVDMLASKIGMTQLGTTAGAARPDDGAISNCRPLIDKLLDKLLQKLTTDHDFTYLADLPLMFSLAGQYEMLQGDASEYIQQLYKFMNYTLSLDMNIKIDLQGKGSESAHLKGDAKMVLELDTVSCVKLILSKKEDGVMTMNVLENLMNMPKCSPIYQGTNTYTSQLPELILHFCKSGGVDTLTLASLTSKPLNSGLWKVPCGTVPPLNAGINGLDGFFNDPASMVKRAQDVKANVSENKQQLLEMEANAKQQAAKLMADMNSGGMTSAKTAADLKTIMNMNNTISTGAIANVGRLIIPVTIQTGNTLMIDQTVNAKVSNTQAQMTQIIDYGTLHIQLKPAQSQ